jgi:hypothetical protein
MACFLGWRVATAATRVKEAWTRVRPARMKARMKARGRPQVRASALRELSAAAHSVTVAAQWAAQWAVQRVARRVVARPSSAAHPRECVAVTPRHRVHDRATTHEPHHRRACP